MTDVRRRFVFHGAASAISGHAFRPPKLAGVIASPAASVLSVAGGESRSDVKKAMRLAPWLKIGGAATIAQGGFVDRKAAIEMSWHRGLEEDTLATSTKVGAMVKDLEIVLADPVVGKKQLQVSLLRATLHGSQPTDKSGTPIRLGRETDIKGLSIDGYPCTVVIDRTRFESADTLEKLVAGEMPTLAGARVAGSVLGTSIVLEVKWAKKPHPKARISGNMIEVEDFGRIFLGEILATADTRRLTLMRLQIGSPWGISVGIGDVHTDGSWYPP